MNKQQLTGGRGHEILARMGLQRGGSRGPAYARLRPGMRSSSSACKAVAYNAADGVESAFAEATADMPVPSY